MLADKLAFWVAIIAIADLVWIIVWNVWLK
jgi:hypothetical protein